MTDHHVHGDLGNDDLPGVNDDPRVAADKDEIAHWNKVEGDSGQLTPLVISQHPYTTSVKTSQLSNTSMKQ
jgi:hypothetical protein